MEEAGSTCEEAAARLTDAVAERGRVLRSRWQGRQSAEAETEELRLALRHYRELTERLLRI